MSAKNSGPVLGLLFCCASVQAYGACDQVSPNPNPAGSTVVNSSTNGCVGAPFVNTGTFVNVGEVTDFGYAEDTAFTNQGLIQNSGTIHWGYLLNQSTIVNSGTMKPTYAGSSLDNRGTLFNSGTVYNTGGVVTNDGLVLNTGTFQVIRDFSNQGVFINNGEFISNGFMHNSGTFINSSTFGPETGGIYFQSGGLTVNNGDMTVQTLDFRAGLFQGNGSIEIVDRDNGYPRGSRMSVTGGTVNVGDVGESVGQLNVNGRFDMTAGTLLSEIAGPGISDLLAVTDSASFLAGTFAFSFLNGYLPGVGDSWTFLEAAGGITGWENLALAYSGVPANYLFSVSERDNSLVLSVAAVPEPEVYASMAFGLMMLGFLRHRQRTKASA